MAFGLREEEKMLQLKQMGINLAALAALTASFALLFNAATVANAGPEGSKIFAENCASCHANGGNIVDPKKPVKGSKILASKQTLKDLLLKPKGAMTPFPKIANSDADLSALYDYCKSLK